VNGDERGSWYLLTGLILGVILGLAYAWVVQPVAYVDTYPESLTPQYKDFYRGLIAAAYAGNPNIERARDRLALLKDADIYRALSEQAQRTLAENGSASQARALGMLAIALGQEAPGPGVVVTSAGGTPTATDALAFADTPAGEAPASAAPTDMAVMSAPSETPPLPTETLVSATLTPTLAIVVPPTATFPPRPTPTITPTRTPTATPGAPFLLLSREKVCDQSFPEPLIIVEALDRFNQPVAGVLVIVAWPGGEERFYTGLKPEKGPGYADFSPASGILYTLRLGENGQAQEDLAALVCITASGERHWGAWRLRFVQP
jgi:hypothetical protein